MAALTLLGSLLARQFQVKASAETPPVGVEAAAAGKEDAAFPALLEGLVGVHVQNGAANFGLPAIADRVAALTLPGSLLARQFQAKASAETPPVGAEAPFAGKEDAALPALFEGLAGGFAAADAASPAAALLARGESLPAGHVRSSGGHTRGKFTESERPIARTGRVRLPDKAEPDIDLVTVRPMDAKPAVPEVKPAAQLVASLAVPEPQIAEAGAAAEQSVSPPAPRITEPPVQPAAATKVGIPKIQRTAQTLASVKTPPTEVRTAARPDVGIPKKAPALPPVDAAHAPLEGTPTESALPESGDPVPSSPPPGSHQAAEQPVIEWAPKAMRAARQSTVMNPGRHQQTSAAVTPPAVPEMPVSAAPAAIVPENPPPAVNPVAGAAPEVSPSRSLASNLSATGVKPAMPLRAPADAKEPASPSVSGEPPVAARLDNWLKSPVSTATWTANAPADLVAGVSPRNADSLAPGGAKVRTLSVASPDRGDVAFTVELRPAEEQPVPTERQTPQTVVAPAKPAAAEVVAVVERRSEQAAPVPREDSAPLVEISGRGGDADRPATGDRDKQQPAPGRSPRPARTVDLHSEAAAAVPEVKVASHWAQSGPPPQDGAPEPAAPPDAAAARPEEPAARTNAKPEVQAAAAHEIKLEVSGGERRVEVRLSERGGEVRVAVRTPDNHLAGTLRESLPELTARFAESGLRSEIWRPAGTPAGELRHAPETASGNLAQDAESQSRGNGGQAQGDARERQQRSFLEPKNDKEKGKDFAWLMSSLR